MALSRPRTSIAGLRKGSKMEFVCPLLVLVDDQSLCGRPLTYTSYSGILLLVCLQVDCNMPLCKYTAVLPKFWRWRSLVPRYFVPRREWLYQLKEQPHREQDSFEAVPCGGVRIPESSAHQQHLNVRYIAGTT